MLSVLSKRIFETEKERRDMRVAGRGKGGDTPTSLLEGQFSNLQSLQEPLAIHISKFKFKDE